MSLRGFRLKASFLSGMMFCAWAEDGSILQTLEHLREVILVVSAEHQVVLQVHLQYKETSVCGHFELTKLP